MSPLAAAVLDHLELSPTLTSNSKDGTSARLHSEWLKRLSALVRRECDLLTRHLSETESAPRFEASAVDSRSECSR